MHSKGTDVPDESVPQTPRNSARRAPRPLHGQPKGGVTRGQAQPNPFAEYSIALTNTEGAQRVVLLRERTPEGHHRSVIVFPYEPPSEVLGVLAAAGFARAPTGCAWGKSLGANPGVEYRRVQTVFEDIGNTLRVSNGVPPIRTTDHSPV